jgi:hypothetical protein
MEDVLQNIPDNDVFMDYCGVFSKTWESHLATLDMILTRLQDNGVTINPLKCEWAVQETDWLGHWLTPTGLKPWRKKIEPLLRLAPPRSVTQVRQFVGAVMFYRDFFRRRSHVLAPLTALIGTKKFDWTPDCDRAFRCTRHCERSAQSYLAPSSTCTPPPQPYVQASEQPPRALWAPPN